MTESNLADLARFAAEQQAEIDSLSTVVIDGKEHYRAPSGKFYDPEFEVLRSKMTYPTAMVFGTLSSMVEYLASNADEFDHDKWMIEVNTPELVTLSSSLDLYNCRQCRAMSKVGYGPFVFGRKFSVEDFIVQLLGGFEQTESITELLGLLKQGVEISNVKDATDDGVRQTVTMKKSSGFKFNAEFEPIMNVVPYRTFLEVDQPPSKCYFRMTEVGDEWQASLILADGGRWEIDAVDSIKDFLKLKTEAAGVKIPILG